IIVPKKKDKKVVKENKFSIHLVCGGGTGKEIMNYLDKYQIEVSCGVLNRGDTDWEEAKRLNYKIIEIPPFAPIDQKAIESVKEEIEKSDMVVVANTPFGWGNIDNIEVLNKIKNKEIIFLIEDNIAKRDFTEGKVASIMEKIKGENKIYKVDNIKKLFDFIKQNYEENIYD
ncbi:MAG: ABC transporter, partial [Halanaerobiales bacterium]|nr:ABC transporter [Halanaerobiales bacterium]